MTQQRRSTYPRQPKKNGSKKKQHKYRSHLNELRPTWKNNPGKIKPMILDMVNKKYPENLERYLAMGFIERFLGIHQMKIKKSQTATYDEIKHWVMIQGIKYLTDAFVEFRKNEYVIRYWIRKEFHLAFLDKEIENMKKQWQHYNRINKDEPDKTSIAEILEDGRLPKPGTIEFEYLPHALSTLQYTDFLNAEKKRLLTEDMPGTVKVPIEIRMGSESHEDQLMVTIPAGFFKSFQKESIKEDEVQSDILQIAQVSPNPKFYTRSETAGILGISLPKLDQLTRDGIIKCHRIGETSMKRYRNEDTQAGVKQIDYEFKKRFV